MPTPLPTNYELRTTHSGLTLIELIFAISILVIVSGIGFGMDVGSLRRASAGSDQDNLIALISRARSAALANQFESDHGVFVGTSSMVRFKGSSYAARDPQYDEVLQLGTDLSEASITEIVFRSGDAFVAAPGEFIFLSEQGIFRIAINSEGGLDW